MPSSMRPRVQTVQIAAAWSLTCSQSRTFIPSPYTGSGSSASARVIIRGISFSGNWKGP
jgi:hypothetical protein